VRLPAALHRLLLTQTLRETRRAICEDAAALCGADAVHLLEHDEAGALVLTCSYGASTAAIDRLSNARVETLPHCWRDDGRLVLAYPLRHHHTVVGALVLVCVGGTSLDDAEQWAIRRYHDAAAAALTGARARDDLGRLTMTDPLTGVLNRRGLERALADAGSEPGLLTIGFDGLKTLNDECDFSVGDAVLVALGTALTASSRPGEAVARLGGDEFMVVVPRADAAELEARAASLSAELDRVDVPPAAQALYRGATVGATLAEPGEPPDLLLRRATHQMRTAKRRRKSDRAA
jgi:diguanylate cyclase (GGDEF)-like protein